MSTKGSVFITGCSDGGIGSGLALAFQQRGYQVFATARNIGKMSHLKGLPNLNLMQLDVLSPEGIHAAVNAVAEKTGGTLSVLINNAGSFHYIPLLDDDIEAAKKIFDTNVWGPLALTKAFAPLLIKGQGMLVNITSIAGHNAMPYSGVYGASKRSLEHISEVLRLELDPFQVKVLSIVTGGVASSNQASGDIVLPSSSLYKPIEATMTGSRGHGAYARMPITEYANQVVGHIEIGSTGKVWVGSHAEDAKIASLDPKVATQWEGVLLKNMGLTELSEKLEAQVQTGTSS
ncbi:Hydroxybutyrate dehydrogenase [Penicillium sp. IBT 16267x]|nr:Hydroxybutyrate dehydrogenase [Penicillium sp. IBT 16267x]